MISNSQSDLRSVGTETVAWLEAARLPVPSVYLLKSRFQRVLLPVVRVLFGFGITANQVTIFAGALSVGFGLLLGWQLQSNLLLLLLPLILFARMTLNAMDGMLARGFGQKSDLGAYLNELGDVISDVSLYCPLVYLPGLDARWMVAVILLAVVSEMAGVMAVMVGAGRRYDGPMGKSDRAFVFGALAFWLGLRWSFPRWAACWFPRLMCVLLVATVVNRVRNGLAEKEIVHG